MTNDREPGGDGVALGDEAVGAVAPFLARWWQEARKDPAGKCAKLGQVKGAPVVLLAALALAACGGSSSPKHSTRLPLPATTSQTTVASVPTTTGTAPPPQNGTPPCRGANLLLTYLGGQGATGHGELGFELRNTSTTPCHTYGYPGVLFLDKSGVGLRTIPMHTTQDYFGATPLISLTVNPQQSVSFRLGVTHGIASTAGCTTAYGLQVIAPDDTAMLHTAIPGGAYECRTVTVSPLRPGTTAYP